MDIKYGQSVSLPHSRRNSWKAKRDNNRTSDSNASGAGQQSSSSHRNNRRRRSNCSKLTRTNSASMPDMHTETNAANTNSRNQRSTSDPAATIASHIHNGSCRASGCPEGVVRSFKTTAKGCIVENNDISKSHSSNSLRSSGCLNNNNGGRVASSNGQQDGGFLAASGSIISGSCVEDSSLCVGSISGSNSSSRRVSMERESTESYDSRSGSVDDGKASHQSMIPNIRVVSPSYFRTLVLGDSGVGKSSLVQQFTRATDLAGNDEEDSWASGNRHLVSVALDDYEATMEFIDGADVELELESYRADAYTILYSVSEPASFQRAIELVQHLRLDLDSDRPMFLVANKTDLVRQSRIMSSDACYLASSNGCHFIEISTSLNVNVDKLLVGLLCSIKHQLTPPIPGSNGIACKDHPFTPTPAACSTGPNQSTNRNAAHRSSFPGCSANNDGFSSMFSSFGCYGGCNHCHKSSGGGGRRRGSSGKERKDRRASGSSSGKSQELTSGPNCSNDISSLLPSSSLFCLMCPGSPSAFASCNIPELDRTSKLPNNTISAIGKFIKQACSRDSKRLVTHA